MFPIIVKWPITIYTYGAMISIGVMVALFLLLKIAKRERINPDQIMDLIIWILILGFAGARIMYIVVEWDSFIASPLRVILSRSGFVFYGGVISGIFVAIWRIRRMGLDLWKTLDMIALVVPLAHAFGRIGCFCFGCCYGRECHSWLGIKFPISSPAGAGGVPVIPTQLISVVALVILFLVLWMIYKHKNIDGKVSGNYILLYSIMRFIIEIFRGDNRGGIWILSTSQIVSIGMFIAGIGILLKLRNRKEKGVNSLNNG